LLGPVAGLLISGAEPVGCVMSESQPGGQSVFTQICCGPVILVGRQCADTQREGQLQQ